MFLVSEYMNYIEGENELERMYKIKCYYLLFCVIILFGQFLNLIY